MYFRLALVGVFGFCLMSSGGHSQIVLPPSSRLLGDFRDWSTRSGVSQGATICYAGSTPEAIVGRRLGLPRVYVTHWPSIRSYNEVSFYTGYHHRSGSTLQVTIGSRTFRLAVNEQWAFLPEDVDPLPLVRAIRQGATMMTEGTPRAGSSAYSSTYSLRGSSQAIRTANEACQVPRSAQ